MPVALRRLSIVGLVFAFACGPTQRRSAVAVEVSSGASAHSQESPCTADRAECGPALGWADCDDCDTDELATRGGRAVLVDCLGEALRCGPDAARQERYELHGRREEWSVRHRARAVRGLASLAPEGTAMLEQSRAWTLPESVVDAIDLELGAPQGLVPPGGAAPCPAAPATATPVDAALACFRTQIKPALLSLGDRAAHYRFGTGDYLRTTYELEPTATLESRTGLEIQRDLSRIPPLLLSQTTLLGDLSQAEPARTWAVVRLTFQSPQLPDDGGAALVFIVDEATRQTVFAYRVVMG